MIPATGCDDTTNLHLLENRYIYDKRPHRFFSLCSDDEVQDIFSGYFADKCGLANWPFSFSALMKEKLALITVADDGGSGDPRSVACVPICLISRSQA